MRVAKRTDWKTKSLPVRRAVIILDGEYSSADMQLIRQGHLPRRMEDKWFIYWEDDRLFFHRSWSGYCVYVVHFEQASEAGKMVRAEVNRDPEQYGETSDALDAKMIFYLIDAFLLGRDTKAPKRKE